MPVQAPMFLPDARPNALNAFIDAAGQKLWKRRIEELQDLGRGSQRSARATLQHHAIELALDRMASGMNRPPSYGERLVAALAGEAAQVYSRLPKAGRARMRASLAASLSGPNTLVPLLHLFRTAALQRSRGFTVTYSGLADDTQYDLLIARGGMEVEIACDTVSAEEGRDVHRGAFSQLVDRIDHDLQTWLASHPGRYLLKMTLPQGLKRETEGDGSANLSVLQTRIREMLESRRRADHDEAAVLRLDPLMLAVAQASSASGDTSVGTGGLMPSLRREFGNEAHLAVTATGGGLFVLAARAGRENEVAVAIRRRMFAIAPMRLSGTRPGILAMFIEDTDRTEWRDLREKLELEGEARQFLANAAARQVVAVTCASRLEMMGAVAPDGAPDGEFRFRNSSHPAAKAAALAPAVMSSI
jgi:hypothetical protein